MTTREHLNRIRKRGLLSAMAFAIIALIVGLASPGTKALPFVIPIGMALTVGSLSVLYFLGHCLACRKRLGPPFAYRAGFRISPDFRFCPYCGASIDEPTAP